MLHYNIGGMKIEEAIKQKKFKSEYHKAMINIIYTGNWLNSRSFQMFKDSEISNEQYNILRILRGQHPKAASVNLLIDRMLDKMSNASRLVEKLRKKELVARKTCNHDRRQVDIIITKKGLELLSKLDHKITEMESSIRNLSNKESKILNELLNKLRS